MDYEKLEQKLLQTSASLSMQLATVAQKVQRKYDYYNADNLITALGISMPVKMSHLQPGVGWAAKAVTSLSDRLNFDGFANDKYGINKYLSDINAYEMLDGLIVDALIAGCSFALLNWSDELGRYDVTPFTAQEATGVIDRKTGLMKMGLAVLEWGNKPIMPAQTQTMANSYPKSWIITLPNLSAIFVNQQLVRVVENPTGRNLLHAFTHRRNTDRPLGKSRISKTARRIINEMGRIKQRQEVAEEFYSTPQRYINGLANGAEVDQQVDLAIGKWLSLTKDEDGDKPELGQMAQMSISGFTEAKKDLARDFCAETGLTLRNLGYETGNPTSADSLKTMSDDLLLAAQNAQNELGEQIKQLAITLKVANDRSTEVPEGLKELTPMWKPIFQTDLGAVGDFAIKILQVAPELAGTPTFYRMIGMSTKEIDQLKGQGNATTRFVTEASQQGESNA